MKNNVIFAALAVAASALVLSGVLHGNKNIDTLITTTSEKTIQKYILKDYNGRIAVFYQGSETPNEIFEIYTRTLPPEDAEKIERGIEIDGLDELSEMLTDYTS